MISKFTLYCTVASPKPSDKLRFTRQFDCIRDVYLFLENYGHLIKPDWLLLQNHRRLTSKEHVSSSNNMCYEQELPF